MKEPAPALPAVVRARVLALAADRLGNLPTEDMPPSLRAVARFTPAKRARLGGVALAGALEADPVFRRQVAEAVPTLLAQALRDGAPPPAADPFDVAAAAYLLRPAAWMSYVESAVAEVTRRAERAVGAAAADAVDAVQRLTDQLEQVRAASRAELARAREAEQALTAEVAALRRQLRAMGDRAGRSEAARREAEQSQVQDRTRLAAAESGHEAALGVLADRLERAERAVTDRQRSERSTAREGRQDEALRLRLLLDALVGAANGLRRELALPPAQGRPADALAGDYAPPTGGAASGTDQGRLDDDPALLAGLLALPATHLLVDGYNVTKTAYGGLPLEAQRARLLAGLGGLAARTGAEVTVVFDGAERVLAVAATAPRGVRLLFSRKGESADEVLRRLVRHEPTGRPLVVVSTDREVADGVRANGARPIASLALARLLERSVGGGP